MEEQKNNPINGRTEKKPGQWKTLDKQIGPMEDWID